MKTLALVVAGAMLLAACTGASMTPSPAQTSTPDATTSPTAPTGTPAGSPNAVPTATPTSPAPTAAATAGPVAISVVATITVLADFVRQVAGDRAEVHALVPRGVDPHTFDPSPSDAILVSRADLLVMNGLGLDEWLEDFIEQVGAEGVPVVELAEDLAGVDYLEGDEHHRDDEDEHNDAYNPHLWMNVSYARLYVERIADELSAVDPAGDAEYRANAAAYDAELADLDDWIQQQLAVIPAGDRDVVSFHHAFPYFAEAYGLEIVGVLVETPGQDPSPREVAQLIREIRERNVQLVFAEAQFSDQLAQTLAAETDAVVVNQLYTDALGDPPADTFVGAMRWNVEQILQGLE